MNIAISGIAHEMRVVANMIENNCEPTIGAKTAKQTREVERSLRAAELRKFADRIEKAIHLEYARMKPTMAKSRNKMPHSKCENCEPCYYIDESKGRLVPGFTCIIEEWDTETSCTRNGCRHYRRSRTDYVILDDPQPKQKGANHEK